jgi:DNA-directed RNA polymerase subunit N (RpoN/RPB10)
MAKELLSWTCHKCGKVITSLYPRQLEQNKKAHLETHAEATD